MSGLGVKYAPSKALSLKEARSKNSEGVTKLWELANNILQDPGSFVKTWNGSKAKWTVKDLRESVDGVSVLDLLVQKAANYAEPFFVMFETLKDKLTADDFRYPNEGLVWKGKSPLWTIATRAKTKPELFVAVWNQFKTFTVDDFLIHPSDGPLKDTLAITFLADAAEYHKYSKCQDFLDAWAELRQASTHADVKILASVSLTGRTITIL